MFVRYPEGLLPCAGVRLDGRRCRVRQLHLLCRGHSDGYCGKGSVPPPGRAHCDVHRGAQDAVAARAAEEEVSNVVGPGDSVRPPEAQVKTGYDYSMRMHHLFISTTGSCK